MHYRFPIIEDFEQVRLAVEGYDEFVIAHRDGFKVVNYVAMTSDTFRPPEVQEDGTWHYSQMEKIRRECRGIIFDSKTDKLIRRPFHKFFNLNERMETMSDVVDLTLARRLYLKLDGSMIAPFITSDNRFRIGTKMGETEIADQVKDWLVPSGNLSWIEKCREVIADGITPIFEWMSPWNTVVVRHSTPKLTLIALRDMKTGHYYNVHNFGARYGFEDIVRVYENDAKDQAEIIHAVRQFVDEEGIVAEFEGGGRVKVKGDWYTAIHKVKDNLLHERNLATLILEETIDDVIVYLDQVDRERIAVYQHQLRELLYTKAENVYESVWRAIHERNESRKDFAINTVKTLGPFASIAFKLFEMDLPKDNDALWREKSEAAVRQLMLKNASTNGKWADFKKAAAVKKDELIWP